MGLPATMKQYSGSAGLLVLGAACLVSTAILAWAHRGSPAPGDRVEVVFWHFWGGADRKVVENVVRRFNQSQATYWVRPVAVPGNNLDAKLFLAISGKDPPDLVNQDDPIVGDWASRGVIQPIAEIAGQETTAQLAEWLFPAARRLGTYGDRLYAVCNGLDIRALYYNRTILEQHGLSPPYSTEQLDEIARTLSPPDAPGGRASEARKYFAYLPDSRRLWAWGYVFGGRFYDPARRQVTADSRPIVEALQWMTQYSRWYGPDTIAAFRHGDQSLPGKSFHLLPADDRSMVGRYVLLMDGQWRTRDIDAFLADRRARQISAPQFGVCPLPYPSGGRANAGWVNGNFFVVPRGAKNPRGAWEFIRFWTGFGEENQAALTCAAGGWIPVSQQVVQQPAFQQHLRAHPLFAEFVQLASSDNQFSIPVIAGASFFRREIERAAASAMAQPNRDVAQLLQESTRQIQAQLDRIAEVDDVR